jgi:hypothetical protein
MTVPGVLDDQALRRYRELLDVHFEADLDAWRSALSRKLAFLQRRGIDIPEPAIV